MTHTHRTPAAPLQIIVLALFVALTALPHPAQAAQAGDRGGGPNITFPETLLRQNGGPVINIKRPPEAGMHAAKGTAWPTTRRRFWTPGTC